MTDSLPDIGTVTTARIDGLEIRFARSGKADGIPVLLTSPWPESIYAYRGILPAIEAAHPLLALDLPGFGRSEGRPDVLSPEGMGAFISKVARHFGIDRMHAIGPDVGTPTLLFAAALNPALFESLIVGSGAASPELAELGLKDAIASPVGAFAEMDGGELGAGFVAQWAAVPTPPAVLEDYRLSAAGRRFENQSNFVRAYKKDLPRLKDLLPNIQTPVRILAGKSDLFVPPANGQLLDDHLPNSRYTLLEGGHFVWEDVPAEYSAHVSAWLGGEYRSV